MIRTIMLGVLVFTLISCEREQELPNSNIFYSEVTEAYPHLEMKRDTTNTGRKKFYLWDSEKEEKFTGTLDYDGSDGLQIKSVYQDGKLFKSTVRYSDGKLKSVSNNELGTGELYDEQGNLTLKYSGNMLAGYAFGVPYKGDTTGYINYYPNGNMESIQPMRFDPNNPEKILTSGYSKKWYETGELWVEGQMVDSNPHGEWKTFDKEGNVIWTQVYENGKLISDSKQKP